MPSQQQDVARWMFTVFIDNEEEEALIHSKINGLVGDSTGVKFMVYQLELAPSTGSKLVIFYI